MPPRNPQKTQADFPQLVADLIASLRLQGEGIGLLDFLPSIQPVFIIGERGLGFTSNPVVFESGEVFSGRAINPIAAQIIVDTGPLPAGTYDVALAWGEDSAAAQGHGTFEHRNAANSATLASWETGWGALANAVAQTSPRSFGYILALNERLRFINVIGIVGGVAVHANIMAAVRPVP